MCVCVCVCVCARNSILKELHRWRQKKKRKKILHRDDDCGWPSSQLQFACTWINGSAPLKHFHILKSFHFQQHWWMWWPSPELSGSHVHNTDWQNHKPFLSCLNNKLLEENGLVGGSSWLLLPVSSNCVCCVFTCYSCCAGAVVQDRQLPKYFSLTDGAEFLSLFSHLNHSLC